MTPQSAEWTLQVTSSDGIEKATFESRQDALDHACALAGDYDGTIEIVIFSPEGRREIIPMQGHDGTNPMRVGRG